MLERTRDGTPWSTPDGCNTLAIHGSCSILHTDQIERRLGAAHRRGAGRTAPASLVDLHRGSKEGKYRPRRRWEVVHGRAGIEDAQSADNASNVDAPLQRDAYRHRIAPFHATARQRLQCPLQADDGGVCLGTEAVL